MTPLGWLGPKTSTQTNKQNSQHKEKKKRCSSLQDFASQPSPHSTTTEDSDDDASDLELSAGNKDTFVLQVRK